MAEEQSCEVGSTLASLPLMTSNIFSENIKLSDTN